MKQLDYKNVIELIKHYIVNEDSLILTKHVDEFVKNGDFVGDMYSYVICEPQKNKAPLVYFVGGPFDVISKKAPQQALVWHEGKLLLNIDYTEFAALRTGAMDSLLLTSLGYKEVVNKKILYFGSGNNATWSMRILKQIYPEVTHLDVVNTRGADELLETEINKIGITVTVSKKEDIVLSDYDFIFCHTNAKNTVITSEDKQLIKQGAVITSYLTSAEHGELSDDFYDETNADVIIDWDKNIDITPDLTRAIKSKYIKSESIILLKDIATKEKQLNTSKYYTVARFKGTPMQNVAVLKQLIKN